MKPKGLKRADCGTPRVAKKAEMGRFYQLVAGMKIRTRNKKDRHLPTSEAIRLLEDYGVYTLGDGLIKAPKRLLKKTTVNRYPRRWDYDITNLTIGVPPTSVQKHTIAYCMHNHIGR
jgi:hypothetical protein